MNAYISMELSASRWLSFAFLIPNTSIYLPKCFDHFYHLANSDPGENPKLSPVGKLWKMVAITGLSYLTGGTMESRSLCTKSLALVEENSTVSSLVLLACHVHRTEQPSCTGESLTLIQADTLPWKLVSTHWCGHRMCAGHQKSLLQLTGRAAGDEASSGGKGQNLKARGYPSLELYSVLRGQPWKTSGRRAVSNSHSG